MVLVFFLGEYGETPQTLAGKIIALFLLMTGLIAVATLIGKISSVFIRLNMEVRMPRNIKDHIVICNWNDRGDRIIREIHSPLAAPETEIIVISDDSYDEQTLRLIKEYNKVFFFKSDPTLHEVLKEAKAHRAKSVIILAEADCADPDAKTALISLAITKLEQNLPRKPHIIAEVIDHNKIQHLVDAGVDEWVCSTDFGLGIIAQSAVFGKLSVVYQQLLTYSKDTNEIYVVSDRKYDSKMKGMTFAEASRLFNSYRDPDNPVILIGIKRQGKIILNPRSEEFDIINDGDDLIVMSFDQPVLTGSLG
jgi:voltage-gated potassium channel